MYRTRAVRATTIYSAIAVATTLHVSGPSEAPSAQPSACVRSESKCASVKCVHEVRSPRTLLSSSITTSPPCTYR